MGSSTETVASSDATDPTASNATETQPSADDDVGGDPADNTTEDTTGLVNPSMDGSTADEAATPMDEQPTNDDATSQDQAPMMRDGLYGFFPTTVTEAEVQTMYESWRSEWTESCGDGRVRVRWDDPGKTVSEGIGYGMLLAASWQDRETFDGMLAYYQSHLNANGLMGWIGDCNATDDDGAATDADLDVAMSLLMADCIWPDGTYGVEATSVINALDTTVLMDDGGHQFLCAGDGWGPDCCGNPSYQTPAYYRAFAAHVPEAADTWNQAAADSYYYLDKYVNSTTGLMPDWMDPDVLQCDAKDPGDWHGWDASRVPWRVTTDYTWWDIPEAQQYAALVAGFVAGQGGVASTCQGYALDGSNCSGTPVTTFAGSFATSAIAVDQATADQFFSDLKQVDSSGYFNAILNVLYFTLAVERFVPGCH
jgi:endo-1,4-beta-D-glucanase Y